MSADTAGAKTVDDLSEKNLAPLIGLVRRFDGRANSSEWADAMHMDTNNLGYHRSTLQRHGLIEETGDEVNVPDAPPHVTAKVFEVTDRGQEVANAHADDIVLPMPPEVMVNEIRSLRAQVRDYEERQAELEERLDEMGKKHEGLVDVVEDHLANQ